MGIRDPPKNTLARRRRFATAPCSAVGPALSDERSARLQGLTRCVGLPIFGTRMVRVLTVARGTQGTFTLTYNPFTLKEM